LRAAQDEAQAVLAETLEGHALQVLRHAEAVAKLSGPSAQCKSVDCAATLLRESGVELAAALGVWASETDASAPGFVYVTLVDRRGDRFPGKHAVAGKDLARATRAALLEARALQLLGPGPWLRVEGEPAGAEVVVDGKTAGRVPLRMRVSSGRHTLQVKHPSHRTHVQSVDVPPNAARQVELEVKLVARPEQDARVGTDIELTADMPEGETEGPPIVGPVILGAAGVGLLAYDVLLLAQSGCDRREQGVCTKRNEVNEVPAVAYGVLGVGAVVGALLWYVLGSEGEPEQALLAPHPGGAALRATF
jgi:hypothetical protein